VYSDYLHVSTAKGHGAWAQLQDEGGEEAGEEGGEKGRGREGRGKGQEGREEATGNWT
jgi:hypothetical protein